MAHALIWVRESIARIDGNYAPRILPQHTKKRAMRDEILRPLKELEARMAKSHSDIQAAYQATTREQG
jgi:hypothetical protein